MTMPAFVPVKNIEFGIGLILEGPCHQFFDSQRMKKDAVGVLEVSELEIIELSADVFNETGA